MTTSIAIPTIELRAAGQSPWLDQISRKLILSGRLKELIDSFGLLGVTSNPSIFEKAINQKGGGYEADILKMIRAGKSTFDIYDTLTVAEIRTACDLFAKVYAESKGEHGYVSLEVMPALSYDVQGTVREAKRLFAAVNRPNVMIKVPATTEGIQAVRILIGFGININATLIFTAAQYRDIAHAYLDGLQDLHKAGGKLERVRSVASVFVSRFDSLIDKKIEGLIKPGMDPFSHEQVAGLRGKAAIANSKILFQEFRQIFSSPKFTTLKSHGANSQKLLWGSTSTKNPAYPELMYVEPLIGRDTVNTIPMETLEAFIDHGHVHADSIEENVAEAYETSARMKALGIDLAEIGNQLQKQGVIAFCESFDQLMKSIESVRLEEGMANKSERSAKTSVICSPGTDRLRRTVEGFSGKLEKINFLDRFLAKDATLWKKDPAHIAIINQRLGWLRVHDWMLGQVYLLERLADEVRERKIKDIVLLGMGGSSLAPEVIHLICTKQQRQMPRFHVLDTTDPGTILSVESAIDMSSTLFVVASKSGGTIEMLSQFRYFFSKVRKYCTKKDGANPAGEHFIAITDKGSELEKLARENCFRHIFINPSDIGGRYSALSFFGLVPAALMGADFRVLLGSASQLFRQFQKETNVRRNPSISLGAFLAALAKSGRDKVTFVLSPALRPFGAWIEQLIAESTGKEGRGIVPVIEDDLADSLCYKQDRAFVFMGLDSESVKKNAEQMRILKRAGFPVMEYCWPNTFALGGEFLRWEIAIAVASSLLAINPFDEPNVKEAKDNTSVVLKTVMNKKQLPGLQNFKTVHSKIAFASFFSKIARGGYLAMLVYGPRTPEMIRRFKAISGCLQNALHLPVLVGFGPRYLHSIGQLYKGGPLKGAFIECLVQGSKDVPIPGAGYRFGQLIKAQALGDLKSLQRKKLPVLTVDLERGDEKVFERFNQQLAAALTSKNKVK